MTTIEERLKEQKAKREAQSSNSPVTEDVYKRYMRGDEDTGMMQVAGQALVDSLNMSTGGGYDMLADVLGLPKASTTGAESAETQKAFAESGLNAATLGASGAADRYGGAAIETLMNDNPEMSFDDFVNQRTAERQRQSSEHPIASGLGSAAGSILGATGAGNLIASKAPAVGNWLAETIAKRLGTATLAGGATNLAIEAGEGDIDSLSDAGMSAGLGALFGAAGQAAGEALNPVGRLVRSKLGLASDNDLNVLAKEALTSEGRKGASTIAAAANAGKGFTPDELAAAAAKQQPGQALSETDPRLLNIHGALAEQPEMAGILEPTRELAERRLAETPKDLQQALLDNLTTSNRGVTGQIEDTKAAAAAAKAKGKDILNTTLDNDFATKYPVHNKKKFLGEVMKATDDQGNPLFDVANAVKSTQNTYKFFEDLVKSAGYNTDDMTLTMMHNIKMDIDRAINSASDATSADRISGKELVKLKKYMKDAIVKIDPDYAAGTSAYATSMKSEEAMEAGANILSGTNKTLPVHEVRTYMDTLLPAEKASVQSGALEWIAGEMDEKATFINKVAKSPAMRQRLELVFGDIIDKNATTVDEIAENIDRILQQRKVFTDMSKATDPSKQVKNAIRSKKDADKGQHLIDLTAIGGKIGTGQLTSGTLWSNARRFIGDSASPENILMLELLQQTDPKKAAEMLTGILHADTRNAGMTGAKLGNALLQGIQGGD